MKQITFKPKATPQPAAFTRCPQCGGMCNIFEGVIYCRKTDNCGWNEKAITKDHHWWKQLIKALA